MHGHVHMPFWLGFLSDWLAGIIHVKTLSAGSVTNASGSLASVAPDTMHLVNVLQVQGLKETAAMNTVTEKGEGRRLPTWSALCWEAEQQRPRGFCGNQRRRLSAKAPAQTSSLLLCLLAQQCLFSDLPRIQ